jgi:hypothetical protein
MPRPAAALLALASVLLFEAASAQPVKDQSRIEAAEGVTQPAPAPVPPPSTADEAPVEPPGGEDLTAPQDEAGAEEPISPDDLNLGEIPTVETVELTPDMAKRALDAFTLVREKYKDANLEDFESLQEFVDQSEQGKAFEADIKAAGFPDVTAWNTAISSVGFAYSALTEDQTEEIKLQIEDIKRDTSIAEDMKTKMVTSLSAMIPSDNNRKVVQALIDDPQYTDKLKLLVEEE